MRTGTQAIHEELLRVARSLAEKCTDLDCSDIIVRII